MNDLHIYDKWLSQIPSDLNLVLDIGANYGDFLEVVFPLKNIKQFLYFEPDADNFKKCQERLDHHPFVKGYNLGIFYGATSCKVQGVGDNNDGGYMVSHIDPSFKDEIWKESIITYSNKTFLLDTLENIISTPADLVKIDIEASEYNLIENSTIIKQCDNLIIEWHNKEMNFILNFIHQHLTNHILIDTEKQYTFLKLKQ
jgi:FkbM family methyltransferase